MNALPVSGATTGGINRFLAWYLGRQDFGTIGSPRLALVRACVALLLTGDSATKPLQHWRLDVGTAYLRLGKVSRTISYMRPRVRRAELHYGVADTVTRAARQLLIAAYQRAGRQVDAVALATHAASQCQQLLGAHALETLQARLDLLECRSAEEPANTCVADAETLVGDAERMLLKDDVITLTAQLFLARMYKRDGRGGDAITLATQVVAAMDRTIGPAHPRTKAAQALLAGL